MKLGKCHQEGDGEEEEVLNFGAQKDLLPSTNSNKDGRNSDKSSAMRSKHSVTEQRRRSKINERFRLLRGLMPNADQKRDTASFLSEVIEYVQYLQEKVQKYEGPLQEWSSEPTKLMPWVEGEKQMEDDVNYLYIEVYDERNSHWRVQGFSGHPPSIKNACDPLQKQVSDAPSANDSHNQHENIAIEGGTISISGEYSQGLLSNLTNALQSAGLDLSHASISVQINIGKRATTSKIARGEDHENPPVGNQLGGHIHNTVNGEDSDQVRKRPKI